MAWRTVKFPAFRTFAPTLSKASLVEKRVCIAGGGVAGLYAAWLLGRVGIPCDIIEANGRIGGRLYTHRFENDNTGYDYYDVGAMRFPKTPFMRRTFNLIASLNAAVKGSVRLIPFHNSSAGSEGYQFFNNVHYPRILPEGATNVKYPYNIATYVPEDYAWVRNPLSMRVRMNTIMKELRRGLLPGSSDLDEFVRGLIREYDPYTMRTYLQYRLRYPTSVINVLETLNGSTGTYDRGLVETILEDIAFDWQREATGQPIEWFCIDQGAAQLAYALARQLTSPVKTNTRVTAIRNHNTSCQTSDGLIVTTEKVAPDSTKTTEETNYAVVISTLTLPALSRVDLGQAGIHSNYAQWSAIRQLAYGSAVKIGIRFSKNWWAEAPLNIIGGDSRTDRPLRVIVYPLYPEHEPKSRVLIVSYCWLQDADRMGSQFDNRTGEIDERLLDLILKELAMIHGVEYDYLRGLVEDRERDCFAHDWSRDPYSMGSYAEFGPSQYADAIFTAMTQPAANGQLWFAGEALSTTHAWVAGALESAERAIFGIMKTFGCPEEDFVRLR
ncbi:amine oxidase [Trametopsis cervina]|nr:amine oxidase [Trametopsis cervina]